MSLKRMVTKLALAFAAKKGMDAFNNAGGIEGVKQMLSGQRGDGSAAAMADTGANQGHGRVGGARASDTGGIGNLLDSLGYSGATDAREGGVTGQMSGTTLGGLFGALAGAIGGQSAAQDRHVMEDQLADDNVSTPEDTRAVLRAMVHMARANGGIQDDEHAALMDILEDASPEERDVLRQSMEEPVDAQDIASDTPAHARKEVYSAALLVGEPDKPAERTFLRNLATHLGLSDEEVSNLHSAMGKPAI